MNRDNLDVRCPKDFLRGGIIFGVITAAFFIVCGIRTCVPGLVYPPGIWLRPAVLTGVLGAFRILLYFNQHIRLPDGNHIEYSALFGNRTTYSFDEITSIKRLKQGSGATVVSVGQNRIFIAVCAIVSTEFKNKLDEASERSDSGSENLC